MTDVAIKKGNNEISSAVTNIFETPSSLYFLPDKWVIDVIMHIPLMSLNEERTLWKRTAIPYGLPFGTKEEIQHAHHDIKRHTVWIIKSAGKLMASYRDQSLTCELDSEVLDHCTRIGQDYYCRHLRRRSDNIEKKL